MVCREKFEKTKLSLAQLKNSVVCVLINSVNGQSWMNQEMAYADRAARQAAYSGYVEEEVVPYIRDCVKDAAAPASVSAAPPSAPSTRPTSSSAGRTCSTA